MSVYQESLPKDIEPFRQLLKSYSNIPNDEIDGHLHKIVSTACYIRTHSISNADPEPKPLCLRVDANK